MLHVDPISAAIDRRRQREDERIRRASAAIYAQGAAPMEAALAAIGAGFDRAAAIHSFKLRILKLFRLGPDHGLVRARFGARLRAINERLDRWDQAARHAGRPLTADFRLDAAIGLVERWYRDERQAFQIAAALGRGSRLSLDVLTELRLILRWLRYTRRAAELRNAA